MAKPLDLSKALSRFKRLPRVDDVWQAAIVALPTWVDDVPGRDPYRPFVALCISTTRPAAHFGDAQVHAPDEPVAAAAILTTLAEMGTSARRTGYRPSVVHVRDPRVVAEVVAALEGTDTGRRRRRTRPWPRGILQP